MAVEVNALNGSNIRTDIYQTHTLARNVSDTDDRLHPPTIARALVMSPRKKAITRCKISCRQYCVAALADLEYRRAYHRVASLSNRINSLPASSTSFLAFMRM